MVRQYIALTLLLLILFPVLVFGQSTPIKVVIKPVTPFVIEENGKLSGFSIDLWQSISQQLNLKTEFIKKSTVSEVFSEIKSNRAALGIAALSITSEREKDYDFSQPMFASGLQIMVPQQNGSGGGQGGIPSFMKVVFGRSVLEMLGFMLLLTLIPAHIVWFVERRHENGGVLETDRYLPGIFKAYWWAAGTLGAQAEEMPRTYLGRFTALVWMFVSIVFVAYFTAAATATLTVERLQGSIKGPEDLPGKSVAATKGSTSAQYLKSVGADLKEVKSVGEAFKALEESSVDAVVFDAPVLMYYAAHEGKGKVEVVGKTFKDENYGIAFPQNSPLRKDVNLALLKLRENGTYQQLYDKWFGDSSKP
jgi:polar amino acid transport system substrate-binding protein